MSIPEDKNTNTPEDPIKEKPKNSPLLLLIIPLFLVACCLCSLAMNIEPSPKTKAQPKGTSTPSLGTEAGAIIACENFVKRSLKAPSSAVFGSFFGPVPMPKAVYNANGQQWVVRGQVDAENGFGAVLRNDFKCVLGFGDRDYVLIMIEVE